MGFFGFGKKKKTFTYKTVDRFGRAESIGVSNSPHLRAGQHAISRGKSVRLIVTSGPLSRSEAERRETRNLRSYRNATGRNPRYNKTSDGKFKKWY